MRIRPKDLESLISTFQENFSPNDHLWLFGSRVDDTKKGGDIDLFIETFETDHARIWKNKIRFLGALKRRIGDQKIDVVIQLVNDKENILPIYQHARETGVKLV